MNSYQDLPKRLEELNAGDKYKAIIERAKNLGYHDYKFDRVPDHPEYSECDCPKIKLVEDLAQFPELQELCADVMNGMYDDKPDASDEMHIRNMLLSDDAPDFMFKSILGQDPPTEEERQIFKNSSKNN
jgi:hypothetical protein